MQHVFIEVDVQNASKSMHMLATILIHLVAPPTVIERTFALSGIYATDGKVIMRRTIFADGSLEWHENTLFDGGDSQTVSILYNADSSLVKWEFTMLQSKEKSIWIAEVKEGVIRINRPMYRNDPMTSTVAEKKSTLDAGDPSKFWWVTKAPSTDYAKLASFFDYGFSSPGAFGDVKLEILPDESLSLKGKTQSVHVVQRTNSYRSEKWWVDDMGMPVKRAYFFKEGSSEAYRVEVLQ